MSHLRPSKNRLQVLFLFKNTFKNAWFTKAKFHKKFTRYYRVIEKNLFRQERRGEINNSPTPFLFRLPEGANKDFLHSFTLDALSRQNNCNLCGCSLSSLTGSNAMISNNISLLKHATVVGQVITALFSIVWKWFEGITSLNTFLPAYFINMLKGNTYWFNLSVLHLVGETIFYFFLLEPVSPLPPWYFEKAGTKVSI